MWRRGREPQKLCGAITPVSNLNGRKAALAWTALPCRIAKVRGVLGAFVNDLWITIRIAGTALKVPCYSLDNDFEIDSQIHKVDLRNLRIINICAAAALRCHCTVVVDTRETGHEDS